MWVEKCIVILQFKLAALKRTNIIFNTRKCICTALTVGMKPVRHMQASTSTSKPGGAQQSHSLLCEHHICNQCDFASSLNASILGRYLKTHRKATTESYETGWVADLQTQI